ncbi:MAG: cyclic nucleotide-binding domain-containing protein [Spirochaetaceae bacterium]|nr:MAG: cyclic nucleotide-binding domain-containing protein [Spirochaetaceae bacterium]
MSALRTIQIFEALSEDEVQGLLGECEFVKYEKGETIIEQNETSTFLCGILSGEVDVFSSGEGDKDIRIGGVGQGDIVGEASIFMEMQRIADVKAKGEVEIVRISREKLIHFVNSLPKAGVKIFAFIIFSLLHKLSSVNRELVFEKESTVTAGDIERLKQYFAPTLEDYMSGQSQTT